MALSMSGIIESDHTQEVNVCELYQQSRVFKVSHINVNNSIKHLYVFCGSQIMAQMSDGSIINMNAFMSDVFVPTYCDNALPPPPTSASVNVVDTITESHRKIMSPFFSHSELANIILNRISVIFVNERLHLDDNIRTIKRKIIRASYSHHFGELGQAASVADQRQYSIDELFLFGKQCVSSFTSQAAYDLLTRSGRDIITRIKMDNFITNIDNLDKFANDLTAYDDECKSKQQYSSGSGSGSGSGMSDVVGKCPIAITLSQKEVYDYDDVRDLALECKMQVINVNIGHTFLEDGFAHIFSVSPFVESSYNPDVLRVPATNTDNQLFMECGLFLFNTIFMCTAHDVMVFSADVENKDDRTGYKALKIYFPFLADKMENAKFEISSSTLDDNTNFQAALLTEVQIEMADSAFSRDCANVNLFYDVYDKRITTVVNPMGGAKSFSYVEQGINFLHTVSKPAAHMVFPIDAVFKTVCTSSELLFVKLNQTSRDSLYKMHAPQVNRFGNKVPFLTTGHFNKINKLCVKSGRVSMYFSNFTGGTAAAHCDELVCEFDTAGQMFIFVKMRGPSTTSVVDDVVRSTVNPVITIINRVIGRSGNSISPYTSVYDVPRVRVINMAYELRVSCDNLVNVKKIFGCGYSIFNNATHVMSAAAEHRQTAHTTTVLNMKRISNFNEQRHIDSFIGQAIADLDLDNDAADAEDPAIEDALTSIVHEVMQRFGLNIDDAQNRVRDVRANSSSDPLHAPNSKSGMRVSINRVRTETSNLTITVENITNIFYLSTFPIYIDAILRIFHKEHTTTIPEALINEMCSTTARAHPQSLTPRSSRRDSTVDSRDEEADATEPSTSKAKAFFDFLPGFGDRSGSESESDSNSSNSSSSSSSRDGKGGGAKGGAKGDAKGAAATKKPADANDEEDYEDDAGEAGGKYPFLKRLQAIDDILFFKSTDKNENAYSRCCQKRTKAHNHAHPVALTDAEMIQFEKDNPEFVTRGGEYPLHPEDMSKTSFYRYSEVIPPPQPNPDQTAVASAAIGSKKPPKPRNKKAGDEIDNDRVVVNAIRYGLTPDKVRWYICPRFWDLRKNKFISERAVISAYPPNPKTGKFNALPKYIYEFESGKEPYVQLYPGFVEQDNAGRHLRMPCCFGKSLNNIRLTADERAHPDRIPSWKKQIADGIIISPYMENQRDAGADELGLGSGVPASPDVATTTTGLKTIFEPSKMPIDAHRLGYLPVPLQKFMFSSMSEHSCGAVGEQCLLRRGVEKNKRRSFIGAIAYIYADYMTNKKKVDQTIPVPTINEMLRIIMAAITLDAFITYHNGSLITRFQTDPAGTTYEIRPEYTTSIIYGQLMRAAETESDAAAKEGKLALLKKMCAAFDIFKQYMEDDASVIDHSMMWDIIATPNPSLFQEGNNMIVLELPENDDTHNVRILCPTNHYADQFFDHRKPTFFLVKKYTYYEPICLHIQTTLTKKSIVYRFNLHNSAESQVSGLFKNIKHAIETVRRTQRAYCAPITSGAATTSGYTQNYSATRVERILLRHGYAIATQILNYDNRVIGFIAEKSVSNEVGGGMVANKIWGYVPTESSELMMEVNALMARNPKQPDNRLPKYDIAYTDDAMIEWQSYRETAAFLNHVHAETKLPCNPVTKVLDDTGTQVIGLITKTNQFVRSVPETDFAGEHEDIKTATASTIGVKGDHFLLDKVVLLNQPPFDPRRFKVANEILLESNFYRAFRTTARYVLNLHFDRKIRGVRKSIENLLLMQSSNARGMPYVNKISAVIALLKSALDDYVAFDGKYDTGAMTEVYNCISIDSCKSRDDGGSGGRRPAYCVYSDASNTCRLMIPKYKLDSHQENEPIYYARLADELIRHERARAYMFSSANYMAIAPGDVRYGKCENEIIIMQSDVNSHFLDRKENREDFIMDRNKNKKNKNKGVVPGPSDRRSERPVFKPRPNTSFFNAKRTERVIGYDEQLANEILQRNDRDDENALDIGSGRPRVVNRPVVGSLSKYVVEQLIDPSKFAIDMFEGVFPVATAVPGGSADPVKETVNGTATFAVMANILHLEKLIEPNENVNKIKSVLCELYAKLNAPNSPIRAPLSRICELFGHFGMGENADSILAGKYDYETFVRSSRYTLTPFDIWLLAVNYKLPIIIMSDATEPDKRDAMFQSNLFRPARAVYLTPEVDSRHYVIVSMQKLRAFPVYGVLSYASVSGVAPTHLIPAAALRPLNETRPYLSPAEFLKSISASSDLALLTPLPPPHIPSASRSRPVPDAAAAAGIESGNESDESAVSAVSDFGADFNYDGSESVRENEPPELKLKTENKPDPKILQPKEYRSLPMQPSVPLPAPTPAPTPARPTSPPVPHKSPIEVMLSDSTQLMHKSLTGLKAATNAVSDTVETRVASKLQTDLAELDNTTTTITAPAAAAAAAAVEKRDA